MARAGAAETSCRHLIVLTLNPAAPSPIADAITLAQLIRDRSATFETCARAPHDTAVILYTSGTT